MPVRHYPDWESFEIAPGTSGSPVAFGADLSAASVLGAYRRGIIPFPAPDEHFRTINEFRFEDQVADGTIGLVGEATGGRGGPGDDPYGVAWWSPDPRPVLSVGQVHLGRNVRKQLRRGGEYTTANTVFGQVAEECRAGREPRWLTDPLLRSLTELHREGWAHSIEVWLDGDLIGGAMGIGTGRVISGDSLFGRCPGVARVAVADMAARLALAGGELVDAQWDSPFLRALGAEPVPRERYLPLLARSAERIALPSAPLTARRLVPGATGKGSLLGWTLEPPPVRNNGFKSALKPKYWSCRIRGPAYRAAIESKPDLAFARRPYCLGWHTPP
jgi:leucyl/phenylalanyl-tRNA---protein transferase